MLFESGSIVEFEYINRKGEKSIRNVCIDCVTYECNEWYKEKQWILKGYDKEKDDICYFAMKNIKNVKQIK